jgi:hypothetical protein
MQRFAPFINIAILLLSVWTGYGALDADTLRGTNPDKYLCIAVLVLMPLFAFGAVSIFGASHGALLRPSWHRVTFSWWRDPLQSLFISTYAVGGMAIGASLHLYGTTTTGFWMFMVFVCMFIGLIVGQLLAYAYHRARITKA